LYRYTANEPTGNSDPTGLVRILKGNWRATETRTTYRLQDFKYEDIGWLTGAGDAIAKEYGKEAIRGGLKGAIENWRKQNLKDRTNWTPIDKIPEGAVPVSQVRTPTTSTESTETQTFYIYILRRGFPIAKGRADFHVRDFRVLPSEWNNKGWTVMEYGKLHANFTKVVTTADIRGKYFGIIWKA
jgi:hypothetical protein